LAGSSLLTLLDDIATLLDDISSALSPRDVISQQKYNKKSTLKALASTLVFTLTICFHKQKLKEAHFGGK
jgi:hypothetical protein